jgi:hypothetical protein
MVAVVTELVNSGGVVSRGENIGRGVPHSGQN